MPVNRADVFESHLLEQNTGDKKIFRKRLHPADELNQMMAARQMAQKELDMSLKSVVAAPGDEFRQAGGDGPDTFRDRHLVVVDNQDEMPLMPPDIVQSFKRDAVAKRAVADHRNNPGLLVAIILQRRGESHRGRKRGTGVSRDKRIMSRFRGILESGKSAVPPDRIKRFITSGKDFVRVRLVPDIPDNLVGRRAEDPVKRHGQFNHAEVGRQMPPVFRYNGNDFLPNFLAKNFQLFLREFLHILRTLDLSEQSIHNAQRPFIILKRYHGFSMDSSSGGKEIRKGPFESQNRKNSVMALSMAPRRGKKKINK